MKLLHWISKCWKIHNLILFKIQKSIGFERKINCSQRIKLAVLFSLDLGQSNVLRFVPKMNTKVAFKPNQTQIWRKNSLKISKNNLKLNTIHLGMLLYGFHWHWISDFIHINLYETQSKECYEFYLLIFVMISKLSHSHLIWYFWHQS